jgi:two-component system response regulator FixJ
VVFVVDDEPRMRTSLALLLKSAGYRTETYGSAEEFLAGYNSSLSGCLILDLCMEGMSGLDLQQEFNRRGIRIPHIIISGFAEVPSVVQAMKCGAMDVLEKPFRDEVLLDRVREAMRQDALSRREATERAEVRSLMNRLSDREREVMQLLVAGKHTKAIARELGISPKTVHAHRARVLDKMHVESVVELAQLVSATRA